MTLTGLSFIGSKRGVAGGDPFYASNRALGEPAAPGYYAASINELNEAAELARKAFLSYRKASGQSRAIFLRAIAAEMEDARDALVARYQLESGLPEARANGELARTLMQIRMFADVAEDGSWVDPRIETALPDRQPLPKPDMRSMWIPIGPVAVFGASNFPLAYSVMGGDSASALAAGCPVIVKAHPAHPGVSEMVANCVLGAAIETGMPEGVFSMLFDSGFTIGQALVQHPHIKGVGFTGSLNGGLALWKLAQARSEPIPVYAEMGSVNPSVVLPGKLADATAIAKTLHTSLTMSMGQFCTKPGLIIVVGSAGTFLDELAKLFEATPTAPMLTEGIARAYCEGVARFSSHVGVLSIPPNQTEKSGPTPALFSCDAATFLGNPTLREEVFGPAGIVVTCTNESEALAVIDRIDGQLTGSIHGTPEDLAVAQALFDALELKVGRMIINGVPTGLEVCAATVHGGPFPATTEPRSTSVGTMAIHRWARPICYQNVPSALLPDVLRT